jgi:PA14 domain/Putative Ig domain
MEQNLARVRTFFFVVVAVFAALLGVTATPASAGTITLDWDPNAEDTVIGYMVHVGTQSGSYTLHLDAGFATAYGWSGATEGQRYCFTVSAYVSGHLEGPMSNEVCGYSSAYPILLNPGSRSSTVGQPTDLQLQGSDPEGQAVSYSATGLPPGLWLIPSAGYISGTPTTAGSYTVIATVSDGVLTSSQTFTWTITSGASVSGGTGGSGGTSGTGLRGDYFYGTSFDIPVATRVEAVDFSWAYGPPIPELFYDNFSVRWTGEVIAPATGWYTFKTFSDDGVRLWVRNQLLIDNWTDHGPTLDEGRLWLEEGGRYPITLEYYEATGWSMISLMWDYRGLAPHVIPQAMLSPTAGSGSGGSGGSSGGSSGGFGGSGLGLRGYYYGGLWETVLTSRVEAVNFNWGYTAPAPEVPADNFSVEWTGHLLAPVSGTYTFWTVSDDGVRLLVGDQWLIDHWTSHASTTDRSAEVYLEAGQMYPVRLDFYESSGAAEIKLLWTVPGRGIEVIPQSALTP